MKLEHFNIAPTQVQCAICGKMISEGTLDRDGESFRAYYCEFPCVNELLRKTYRYLLPMFVSNGCKRGGK